MVFLWLYRYIKMNEPGKILVWQERDLSHVRRLFVSLRYRGSAQLLNKRINCYS